MIIAPRFEGDDDLTAMHMQHDCYNDALSILVNHCNRLARFARLVLADQAFPNWGPVEAFDHRTLQDAHDLIAAAWRFRMNSRQGRLQLEDADPWPGQNKNNWFAWLTFELSTWIDAPELVRAVQIILCNQNAEAGYEAEEDLSIRLIRRFSEVPWANRSAKG